MNGRWKAALHIAEARRPRGEVAMTELMMMSQTVVEMHDEIERLRARLSEIAEAADDEASGPEAVCLGLTAREALRRER